MSPEQRIEQDREAPTGGQELPSYDDLAAQNGPNSRFGRWRGWIEKRAAERYADISPEERNRRRERGWGNDEMNTGPSQPTPDANTSHPSLSGLHIQTRDLPVPPSEPQTPSALPPLPFKSQRLSPSHLKVNQFGSRFLPHATSPIRCLLPLESGKLLLIGHDEGLSVLDMFPQEWSESAGMVTKGPDEARIRPIWRGESVYDMTLIEVETGNDGTPQGVVLALVGSDTDTHGSKDADLMRSLRMYNLASLISLAKWTISQKASIPLDLHRPSNWHVQQSPSKRNKAPNIAKNLKAFIEHPSNPQDPFGPSTDYPTPASPSGLKGSALLRNAAKRSSILSILAPNRKEWDEMSWDVVDDQPLRWATDFVPLAAAGSRLLNTSVLSYAVWSDEGRRGKGGQLLAVATKGSIFLYETPKGERAFRFVKEFYTPLQPRGINFFQQLVPDISRTSIDGSQAHRRTNSSATISSRISPSSSRYSTHLALFVVFDKKSGWIRLADAAVGEVELSDSGAEQLVHQRSTELMNSSSSVIRGRMSLDASAFKWLPISRCMLPQGDDPGLAEVYLLTRGRQTHIVPCPLPIAAMPVHPLSIVTWSSTPTSVSVRVNDAQGKSGGTQVPPCLQFIAFGEDGVEVQEIPLSSLGKGKGKSTSPIEESSRTLEDLGGDTGFLCTGGHWDQTHYPYRRQFSRTPSAVSAVSSSSFSSTETDVMLEKLLKEEGIYAWYRKGAQDWRVFWVGGSFDDGDDDGESGEY